MHQALQDALFILLALYVGFLALNLLLAFLKFSYLFYLSFIWRPTLTFLRLLYRPPAATAAFAYRIAKAVITHRFFTTLVFSLIAFRIIAIWIPVDRWYIVSRWAPAKDPCAVCGRPAVLPCPAQGCDALHYCSLQHMKEDIVQYLYEHPEDASKLGAEAQAQAQAQAHAQGPRTKKQRRRKTNG